jgi:hypothetical protein
LFLFRTIINNKIYLSAKILQVAGKKIEGKLNQNMHDYHNYIVGNTDSKKGNILYNVSYKIKTGISPTASLAISSEYKSP